MISIIGAEIGFALITGLSTDTKPTPNQDEWLFIEVNTGKTCHSLNGEWILNNPQA